MAERDAGAAMRRRQRRMRSWWRHEQLSIAAAVATALHHSAQRGGGVARRPTGPRDSGNKEEVEFEPHAAPRGQSTPPPGTRPGRLAEPVPQGFWPGGPSAAWLWSAVGGSASSGGPGGRGSGLPRPHLSLGLCDGGAEKGGGGAEGGGEGQGEGEGAQGECGEFRAEDAGA